MNNKVTAASICLAALLISIGILQWRSIDADDRMITATEQVQNNAETNITDAPATPSDTQVDMTQYEPRADAGSLTIGNPNAPVTIIEFSSLSCPHCASFHSGALPDLKKDYIDTGKVKFIFRDFPLNAPAVSGSLLLKCVPLSDRYEFMDMLFKQQSEWAFDANYQTKLKQYASLLGIGSEEAEACMNDAMSEKAMFDTMREGNEEFGIQSTPTFIIQPSDEKLTGAQPYGEFSKRIEALLKAE